jgi:lipoate-protein ligase B
VSEHLQTAWLGTVRYADALERQLAAIEERRRGGPDRLLLLEHPPVITLGRSARPEHLKRSRAALEARDVELFEVARGGDVTWHGPGQLVGYLIADLAARGTPDVHAWLRRLEAALIEALGVLGIAARRSEGMTGVFLAQDDPTGAPRKIASIGVGLRGWISWHGFALNVTTASDAFDDIVPCGLSGVRMTSVAEALGVAPTPLLFERTRYAVTASFSASLS